MATEQKTADPLQLELLVLVSLHVGAKNLNLGPLLERQVL